MFYVLHGAGRPLDNLFLDSGQPPPCRLNAIFKPCHSRRKRLFHRALLHIVQLSPYLQKLRRHLIEPFFHAVNIPDQLGKFLGPVALHLGEQGKQFFHVVIVL